MKIIKLSSEEKHFYELCLNWLKLRGKTISFLSEIEGDSYKEKWENIKKPAYTPESKAREEKIKGLRKMQNEILKDTIQERARIR